MNVATPVLVDASGRPLVAATPGAPAPPLLGEISAEGQLGIATAFVDQIIRSRDETLALHGHGDLVLYDRLLTDDQVQPCFRQRRAQVIARELKVEAGGTDPIDIAAADDLRAQLTALPWDRITYRMLGGIMKGRAHAECIYQQDGSRVVLAGVRVRRAQRFGFNAQKQLVLLDRGEHVVMPEKKFWSVTFGAEDDDDPNGLGLGAFLYWPVWFKRNGIKFWSIYLETVAQPTPKAEVPPGMPKPQQAEVMRQLDQIRAGGKIVHPRGTLISYLEAVRNSGGDYSVFCQRWDASIAKITLLQTMTTDAASTGLGSTQGEVQERTGIIGSKSDSDQLTESFQQGPATWLTNWNYPGAKTPILYRDFTQATDQNAAAERDVKLNQVGYRPTPNRVKETYGDGYEPIAAAPAPAVGDTAFAEPDDNPEAAAVDRIVGNGGWRKAMSPLVERLVGFLDDHESLEAVRDRLGDLSLAEPKELADELARMTFAARMQGALGGDEGDAKK